MADPETTSKANQLLDAGHRALVSGAWGASRALLRQAVELDPSAEALEALGLASWWLDDAPAVFEAHREAYRAYRKRGDRLGAARLACAIGLDHYLYRADASIAAAWLRRAHALLDGLPPSREAGWLALWDAHLGLFERNDVRQARLAGTATVVLARDLDDVDLQAFAIAMEGLAMVGAGEVSAGMARLDEAAAIATSGEMTDVDAMVTTMCYVIYACERIRDYPRARRWCDEVEVVSRAWHYRSMFGVCRCHHSSVLIWSGDWAAAERELTRATPELLSTRPGWVNESVVRLAQLRHWQGRAREAKALFDQAPGNPFSFLGLAELALDRGDVPAAMDLVGRFFRRVPPEDRTVRALGLEVATYTWLAAGETAKATVAADEFERIARAVGTSALTASARLARGAVWNAAGDLDAARCACEDAVDLCTADGAPFIVARARLALAGVLRASGREALARQEALQAVETLVSLGAFGEVRRVRQLLDDLDVEFPEPGGNPARAAHMTKRETDVLRLVARGLTNREIADALFVSVRTVEHHVSAIYSRIGAAGPAARAIATVHAIESGLVQALPAGLDADGARK